MLMAGKVATPLHNLSTTSMSNDAAYVWSTMDEHDVIHQLQDQTSGRRAEVIEQLRQLVRRNGMSLPFRDIPRIFEGLALALQESIWDSRHQCVLLISDLIPHFGPGLDQCMNIVLPYLIPNIGDSKITIRRSVVQTLHVYMKYTQQMTHFFRSMVKYGLENPDPKIRKECTVALPLLFTSEFSNVNLQDITKSLAKKLQDSPNGEETLQQPALTALDKIRNLVGVQTFELYINNLPSSLQKKYYQMSGHSSGGPPAPKEAHTPRDHGGSSRGYMSTPRSNPVTPRDYQTPVHAQYQETIPYQTAGSQRFFEDIEDHEFGFVPKYLMTDLWDQDFRVRSQAVEDLKKLLKALEDPGRLKPHLLGFISFLGQQMEDNNFKITTNTLEIIHELAKKLGEAVRPYLNNILSVVIKRMPDNKIVIRKQITKFALELMQILKPQEVVKAFCSHLNNRNSRTRQESLNILIIALLKHPSYHFDLGSISKAVANALIDSKRHVRHAALECVAVLQQCMGPGKMGPLINAVDTIELRAEGDGDGVMAAVQARLSRRQLPKFNEDLGIVEYALAITGSASSGSRGGAPQSPDIDWIMAGAAGGGNSARSFRAAESVESISSPARNTSQESPSSSGPHRRFFSAGRKSLPWEDQEHGDHKSHPTSAPAGHGKSSQLPTSHGPHTSPAQDKFFDDQGVPPVAGPDGRKVSRKDSLRRSSSRSMGQLNEVTYSKHVVRPRGLPRTESVPNASGGVSNRASLPASWNDAKKLDDGHAKPNKPILSPITKEDEKRRVDHKQPQKSLQSPSPKEESPIPLRAALARGNSSKKKMSPMAGGNTPRGDERHESLDSGRVSTDSQASSFLPDERVDVSSLRQIRHSASKKKAEKLFTRAQQRHRSPSPPSLYGSESVGESGVFSRDGSVRTGDDEDSARYSGRGDPFETRTRIPRGDANNNGSPVSKAPKKLTPLETRTEAPPRQEFKPHSGVTFNQNKTLEAAVVGRGYNDDPADRQAAANAARGKDKRRPSKGGSMLSPLGVSSTQGYGSIDIDDDSVPNVVGRGFFDATLHGSDGGGLTSQGTPDVARGYQSERRSSRGDPRDLPAGVYGVSMKQSSMEREDEPEGTVAMSQMLNARIAEKQEEMERRRQEKEEQKRQEKEEQRRREEAERARLKEAEKQRQLAKLRKMSAEQEGRSLPRDEEGDLTISGNQNGTVARKPPPARSSRNSGGTVRKMGSSSTVESAPTDESSPEDWPPFTRPDQALQTALRCLQDDDWEKKVEGLQHMRRLVYHHQNMLSGPTLHTVHVAVLAEVRNLRSQVSRLAIETLADMFDNLKKAMDTDLESVIKVLLPKVGESNQFIREVMDRALAAMVEAVTPQKALTALVNGGASHRNGVVRRITAEFLVLVVEKMGPGRVLSGIRDVTDKILPITAQFVFDSDPHTRFYGRKIFHTLMQHQDFYKMLQKYVTPNSLKSVEGILEQLREKGLSEGPSETGSARARRSGKGSRSRGGSAGQEGSLPSSAANSAKRRGGRIDEATAEEIRSMCNMMSANDWRERNQGIVRLMEMAEASPRVISDSIVKIFDRFAPRLQDNNSKVNMFALEALTQLIVPLREALVAVLSITVQNLVPNLASRNKEIYSTAQVALTAVVECIDGTLLLQPFANQAQSGPPRARIDMIDKVAELVTHVYARRQKPVVLHALPLMWHLVTAGPSAASAQGGGQTVRQASKNLARALHDNMGAALMDHAAQSPNMGARGIQQLQDMLSEP